MTLNDLITELEDIQSELDILVLLQDTNSTLYYLLLNYKRVIEALIEKEQEDPKYKNFKLKN